MKLTMSFITKRDRVFNEYDLFDLPARNEGKLKAYASCTDARAWSHFNSDKTEHLVDIIKRNNETCRPKYVPTDAIVNTLMATKNAEIGRLKHKIEEFEQMLAAYDQLELTCDQKCEIANAHAAIKAANKELDEMCLDLDLSGYTEGIDSEAFQTGKSRGDEGSIHTALEVPKAKVNEWDVESEAMPVMETKANQTGPVEPRDASTYAHDSRIDDLQDIIITKDAKLSAMQNTLAVMENDICEPYCIYAHIYTALEKIFGTLCQNAKYKEYLDLLTIGKDTRNIDVKGKILFKLKVLEKFSMALIAPCSQDYPNQPKQECSCYRAQVDVSFAFTSPSLKTTNLDSKRALLAADIMENIDIKEILSKDSISTKLDDDQIDESFGDNNNSIEEENLRRLKNLQANYEDLLNCYENLKFEKNCLQVKCKKYEDLEKDFELLKHRLQEYNLLWNEKEHYQKRSEDLDNLKEKFIVLSEETSNIETQLKAESEINNIKSKAIDELRSENIMLEKKLNDITISFEKEKNNLTCKLREYECKIMCQEQQIKSLSMQIDQLLEQDRIPSNYDSTRTLELTDEVEALKQQIKNLKNILFCNEEEKHQLQVEFGKKLELINNLKMDIEEWKSKYDKALQSQNYLEKYTKKYQEEMQILKEENKSLSKDKEQKANDIEQFICIINSKSQEMKSLMEELEQRKNENRELYFELQKTTENFDKNLSSLEIEKQNALFSLQLARTDSQKLIGKEEHHSHQYQLDHSNSEHDIEENERCLMNIVDRDNENSVLLQEIHKLRAENITNISKLQDENTMNKKSLELLRTESTELKHKLLQFESISQQFLNLKESHERLIADKINLENELQHKTHEIENLLHLRRKESDTLMDRLQKTRNMHEELTNNYQEIVKDRYSLLSDLSNKDAQLQSLSEKVDEIKVENERLRTEAQRVYFLEQELENLNNTYVHLQNNFENKTKELESLYGTLENKIEENRELSYKVKNLYCSNISSKNSLTALNIEKSNIQSEYNAFKEKNAELLDKVKYYENVENDLCELKLIYDQIKFENKKLQEEIERQTIKFKDLENKNRELNDYSQNLLTYNEELEKNLNTARNENIMCHGKPQDLLGIKKEVENLKLEKNENHEKIKKLLLQIDDSEYIITNLKENLIARDDKISLLENHINELQNEVRKLHSTLADLTETSEQIRDNSLQNVEQSLKRMEAHHSKATHDMRSELAKLQNKNDVLDTQLSESKLKSEESIRDMHKYYSQITCLQNERVAIVSDIKQLEIISSGDSVLSPTNSNVEDVLSSIRKITKCFETKQSKNTSLKNTLLKVQSSFQLVLDKADEEKKNIDEEKKKLFDEKETAITELHVTKKQYQELKQKYEEQAVLDKCMISDLQAELLNQNLIIEKINKSKADYITKLEEDIKSLQNMYETSISKIHELQDKINCLQTDNNKNLDIIEETNRSLTEKCKEINDLQNTLQNIKDKLVDSVSTQVDKIAQICEEKFTQTDNAYSNEKSVSEPVTLGTIGKLKEDSNNINSKFPNNSKNVMTEILPKNEHYSINEVQILRADVDVPTTDYNKSAYISYKIKQLNFGPMEQCSIPSFSNIQDSSIEKSFSNEDNALSGSATQEFFVRDNNNEKSNTIDVYNIQIKSSQNINKSNNRKRTKNSKIVGKLSSNSLSDIKKFTNDVEINISDLKAKLNVKKPKSERDLFVIYNDNDKPTVQESKLFEIYNRDQLEQVNYNDKEAIPTKQKILKKKYKNKKIHQTKNVNSANEVNVKPKLQIDLPRLMNESSSKNSASDGDNKSLDSYTYAIYSSPKRATHSDTNIKKKEDSSNIPMHGSPDMFDKLSHDEKIYDIFLQNQDTNSSQIGSNNQSSNNMNNSASRVNSDFENSKANKSQLPRNDSRHKLSRVGANVLLLEYSDDRSINDTIPSHEVNDSEETLKSVNFGLQYILDTMKCENDPHNVSALNTFKSLKDHSNKVSKKYDRINDLDRFKSLKNHANAPTISNFNDEIGEARIEDCQKSYNEFGVLVKMDSVDDYENKIRHLTRTLENIEKDYKKKIEAVKLQYNSNIKNIINEHNQGVKSIQGLHEETMQDVIKLHENEVENLRTMSIEALRRAEKLEKENQTLKTKIYDNSSIDLDKEPIKIPTPETKRGRGHSRIDTKMLTKTFVEAFNVKPRTKSHGPCTCSIDINISDTIRNIFEQVDVEQRKVAENAYLKYIANKISNNNIEALDAQELSFLHLKVCRTWKTKLSKEEALQKRIDSLESELINKQRQAQLHMAELDRKVAEERRRLREVREAVCRSTSAGSREGSPESSLAAVHAALPKAAVEKTDYGNLKIKACNCNLVSCNSNISGRKSAGDLGPGLSGISKHKRVKGESNRAVLAKLDTEDRRDRKFYDDPPIRLKRSHDRPTLRKK